MRALVKAVTHSRPTISGIYYCASLGGPVGAQSHGEGRQKIVLSQLCNFNKAVRGKEAESKKGRTGDGQNQQKLKPSRDLSPQLI